MSEQPPLLVETAEGVCRLTLNRPEKLNSFNLAMGEALQGALDVCASDDGIRAVVLTGAGRAFCAGQDLGDRDPSKMTEVPDLGGTLERVYNPIIRRIRALEKPVLCAVNGVAAGAGANLALACDIVFAAKSAKFIQVFARIGLLPDSGGTWLLPRLIGEARAKALAMTTEPLAAQTAADWGLIWRATEDDAVLDETLALARQLAVGPTVAYGLIKQAVQAAADQSLDKHLDLERDYQRIAGRTPDYAEGVSAFLEKRPAKFRGVR
ncbi:MAG: 2-(1,2-epoxy-1,2-dihydrophenyl)acetyl-CoA isomerase [Rhodospirillaceae bacterium]|nr:2-(1,2-epoxy-1,2-dihydrophenyl)acetyl-CoA isomerase [Rhodospirillaceae bacterium]